MKPIHKQHHIMLQNGIVVGKMVQINDKAATDDAMHRMDDFFYFSPHPSTPNHHTI